MGADKFVVAAYNKWMISEHKRCGAVAGRRGIELWQMLDNSIKVEPNGALGALLNVEKLCGLLEQVKQEYEGKRWYVKMQEKANIFMVILTEMARRVGCTERELHKHVQDGHVSLKEALVKVGL